MATESVIINFDVDTTQLDKAQQKINELKKSVKSFWFSQEFILCMVACFIFGVTVGLLL